MRWKLPIRISALTLSTALLAGCGGGGSRTPVVPPATLSASIATGAVVSPAESLVISVRGGTLRAVTVVGPDSTPLPGNTDPAKGRWTSGRLGYGATYRVSAEAVNPAGIPTAPLTMWFSTIAEPAETVSVARIRPADGDVVGIAMPISIYFDRAVADRAAVQRRISVLPSVPTEGAFHWVDDDQVNWRPKTYWKAHTEITVRAVLYGVDTGGGVFGAEDFAAHFTVGRDQRAVGDVATHRLRVWQDGVQIRDFAASYGRAAYPTQSGIHVAFEKHRDKRMRSDTWGGPGKGEPGYYDEVLPYAVRISNNGEFVHVNAATTGAQGRRNVSHGCVNLSPADGRWFYDWVQMGDPVEIVGSPRPLTPADGDIPDWTIPWEEYVAGGALPSGALPSGALPSGALPPGI